MRKYTLLDSLESLESLELKLSLSSLAGGVVAAGGLSSAHPVSATLDDDDDDDDDGDGNGDGDNDDDPLPNPEPDPGPDTGTPPIVYPYLPPSGPSGPGS